MASETASSRPPPLGVTLRRASARDALAAADVWLASRHEAASSVPPPVHTDEEVRRWFLDDLLPRGGVWVATAPDDAVVAVMVVEHGWLDQLYVRPDWWGRGIGSALVEMAKWCSPGGLELWTFQSNPGARRLYERLGFEVAATTDGSASEEGAPDVRYRWRPVC